MPTEMPRRPLDLLRKRFLPTKNWRKSTVRSRSSQTRCKLLYYRNICLNNSNKFISKTERGPRTREGRDFCNANLTCKTSLLLNSRLLSKHLWPKDDVSDSWPFMIKKLLTHLFHPIVMMNLYVLEEIYSTWKQFINWCLCKCVLEDCCSVRIIFSISYGIETYTEMELYLPAKNRKSAAFDSIQKLR